MQKPPTSKELYMMNGDITFYIHLDGFWAIYNATPEEEEEVWEKRGYSK